MYLPYMFILVKKRPVNGQHSCFDVHKKMPWAVTPLALSLDPGLTRTRIYIVQPVIVI